MMRPRQSVLIIEDEQVISCQTRSAASVAVFVVATNPISRENWSSALQLAVGEALATMRHSSSARRVTVVLARSGVQVRLIDGLPRTTDSEALRALVAAHPFRFFLRPAGRTVVSHAVVHAPGVVTVALLDRALIEQIAGAVFGAGLAVDDILIARRGLPVVASAEGHARTPNELDMIIAEALEVPHDAWRRVASAYQPTWMPSRAALITGASLMLISMLSPVWRWAELVRRDGPVAPTAGAVALARLRGAQIDSLRQPLERLRELSATAMRPLDLLDLVTAALPPDGRLLAFDADTASVRVTVAAGDLKQFLWRLERNAAVSSVAIIGGITRDSSDGQVQDRVVMRFRYSPSRASRR